MIVMDSGLGGLSVVRAIKEAQPDMAVSYLADTAGFPYGARDGEWVEARANQLVGAISRREPSNVIVLACNTLSTLALESLRQRWQMIFVGTVPAIKVAAEQSRTRRFTLLATPNTAQGAYVSELIEKFASHCVVDSYGAPNLASYAEKLLLGERIPEQTLRDEIIPCFKDDAQGKTDLVILGCTHYPLIVEPLAKAAAWPVGWIDPSPAIARQALSQSHGAGKNIAYVTRQEDIARYEAFFAVEGFARTEILEV